MGHIFRTGLGFMMSPLLVSSKQMSEGIRFDAARTPSSAGSVGQSGLSAGLGCVEDSRRPGERLDKVTFDGDIYIYIYIHIRYPPPQRKKEKNQKNTTA